MNVNEEVAQALVIAGGDFSGKGDFSCPIDPNFGPGNTEAWEDLL